MNPNVGTRELASDRVRRSSPRHLSICVAVSAMLSGCSVGNVGLLGARVASFDGGQSVEVHAPGLGLRSRADDLGVSFGYTRRVYYFGDAETLALGWHFFSIPMPEVDAVALDRRTLGLEFAAGDPAASLVIGYEHVRVHARVPGDASLYLEYGEGPQDLVRYVQCGSVVSCELFNLH